jgi:hypothetical protein
LRSHAQKQSFWACERCDKGIYYKSKQAAVLVKTK